MYDHDWDIGVALKTALLVPLVALLIFNIMRISGCTRDDTTTTTDAITSSYTGQ